MSNAIVSLAVELKMDAEGVRRLVYDRTGNTDTGEAIAAAIEGIKTELRVDEDLYLGEWRSDMYTYKLFAIPRDVIDGGDDDPCPDFVDNFGPIPPYAHDLVGIDSAGLRRVDIRLDTAWGRDIEPDEADAVEWAMESAPDWAKKILIEYVG